MKKLQLLSLNNIVKITKNVFSTTIQISAKKPLTKKSVKKIGLPPKFIDNIKLWPKLLEEETKAKFEKLEVLIASKVGWNEIENRGLCCANISIVDDYSDVTFGRVLSFEPKIANSQKWMRSGSPIAFCVVQEDGHLINLFESFVIEAKDGKFTITCSNAKFQYRPQSKYLVMPSLNNGAIQTLQSLLKSSHLLSGNSIHLVNLAYRAIPMPSLHDRKIKSLSENLNESQVAAVSASLNQQRNLLCVQGPPGTGKTRVIAEMVSELLEKGKKVLVLAPTHVAVRNAHLATVRRMSEKYPDEKIASWLANLSDKIFQQRNNPEYNKLNEMMKKLNSLNTGSTDWRQFRNEVQHESKKIERLFYKPKKAIFGTISTSFISKLSKLDFNAEVIIVDEAAQCTEPATWIPVLTTDSCKKLILVGDQKQLPAVILSEKAMTSGLNVSLMEKLSKEFASSNINILLKEQHRMNSKIMAWSNEVFYDSQLIAHESVENITLADLAPNLQMDSPLNSPILMINMDRIGFRSEENKENRSFKNADEVNLISTYIDRMVTELGIDPADIAVIAPYFAQVIEIRSKIRFRDVDVNTVDAFQGHERQVVIFCLVRDNKEGSLGFLRETRRLNVAVTRAKRQFLLIGSARMMQRNKDLKKLYKYIESENTVFGKELLDCYDNIGLPN